MKAVIIAAGIVLASAGVQAAQLHKATVAAFNDYVRKTEARLDASLKNGKFLWVDDSPAALKEVRDGGVAIRPMTGKGETEVHGGLIHDWMGSVFIPGATVDEVLEVAQDYNRHKYTHKPEVLDSKLIEHDGNHYKAFLRVSKHKVITVVLDTEHDVNYYPVDKTRWWSRSYSTKIAQVENPGQPDERELAPGNDGGYLWRLYSYWRFEQRDGGVYVQCEALSLTRDVPALVSWLVTPIIRELPRESLANTLISTRNAVLARARKQ